MHSARCHANPCTQSERLVGKWGITDVQDAVQTVVQLSSPAYSLIDGRRAVIRGGSAGGFTTLAAMCAASDVFSAGASTCGISDLAKLEEFTHKFESLYLAGLMGGRYAEIPDVYKARSPVNNADKISSPLMVGVLWHTWNLSQLILRFSISSCKGLTML